jgi:hypothetical protein
VIKLLLLTNIAGFNQGGYVAYIFKLLSNFDLLWDLQKPYEPAFFKIIFALVWDHFSNLSWFGRGPTSGDHAN